MNNYNIGDIYQEMEIYLIKSMKRNLSKHLKEEAKYGFNWTQWQVEKLKEIKRFQRENSEIIGNYQNRITKEVSSQLKYQFKEGTKQAQRHFKKAVKNGYKYDGRMNKSFFTINDGKVKSLINSVNNDLKTANTATLRMINDQYREIIYKATMFASNGVLTPSQAIDMATKDFLSRGLNSIEYSNGARVNIASYAKMAVNTAHQRAQLQGEGEFRKKIGNPLIKITKHGTPCKLCQKWEGRVLIDDVYSGGTEKDGNYPLLSEAMNQGLYHPNCRHGVGTYYPELSDIEFDENGPTEETLKNYQEDLNYCNLQISRFNRLSVGSLYKDNILRYSQKKEQWEERKNFMLGSGDKHNSSVLPHKLMQAVDKIKDLDQNKAISYLQLQEEKIVNSDIEHAIFILDDGTCCHSYGVKDNVWPYDDLYNDASLRGRKILYMTHNHPKGESNYSFDGDDRRLWSNNEDLLILRYIDEKYTCQFSRLDPTVINDLKSVEIGDMTFENFQHDWNVREALSSEGKYGYWRKENIQINRK